MSKKSIKIDLARVDRMKDKDIDYSDIPPLGEEFFSKAKQVWPPAKEQLTIRLDSDVLKWLKAHGRGYQTRINHILREAMESQGTEAKRPPRASSAARAARKARGPGRS